MSNLPDVNELLRKELSDRGIQVLDFTGKIHALKFTSPLYLRPGNAIGIVMHNTSGMVTLPNLVGTWKDKEPHPPPSHLAIDQAGVVGRYVRDLKMEAQDKKPQDEIDVVSWSWEYQVAARRILAAEPAPKILLSKYPAQH